MKLIQVAIVLCFFTLLGCTVGSGGGFSAMFTEKEPEAKEARKQIEDIQSNINTDSRYVLNSDEVVFLSEQGVVTDEVELKGWVK